MEQKTEKRKPGRPRKNTNLWRVLPRRVIHISGTHGIPEIWAQSGEILCIDHPILEKYAEGQYHKMQKLDGLPKGSTVKAEIPQRIQREIQTYDTRQLTGGEEAEFPPVGRPSKELEDKINVLEKENAELVARLDVLEGKVQMTEKIG